MIFMSKRAGHAGSAFRAALFAAGLWIAAGPGCLQQVHGQDVQSEPARPQFPVAPIPPPTSDSWINLGEWQGAGEGRQLAPNPGLQVEADCFTRIETALVFPHLSSLLTAPVQLGTNGPGTTVALRNAHLDATVSPLFQFGALRFGPGYGEVAFSYRFLATEGSDIIPAFDGPGAALRRSRLDLQTFGLDYIRNDCHLGPNTVLNWELGARLQVVFFDTQEQTAASFQQARNYFFGAGPQAAVGVTHTLADGMSLYGRFDTAMVLGYNTAQNFTATTNDPVAGVLSGTASQQQTQLSPTFSVQVGMAWTPLELPCCRFRGGYQFEQWYGLGRVANSQGNLNTQGLFVSCELNF